MGGLFGGNKTPTPAPPPPAPDYAAADAARENQAKLDQQRRMAGGRASTQLTGGEGVEGEAETEKKKLLGA